MGVGGRLRGLHVPFGREKVGEVGVRGGRIDEILHHDKDICCISLLCDRDSINLGLNIFIGFCNVCLVGAWGR